MIGSETLSRIVDWSDRQTCVLFGDGAGAVVYEAPPGDGQAVQSADSATRKGILASAMHTDGNYQNLICRPKQAFPVSTLPESIVPSLTDDSSPYIEMRGREVYRMAISSMSDSIVEVLEKAGYGIDDVVLFIQHQSNRRIIDAVCTRVGITDERRVVSNIERVANTSAASIPIALDEVAREGKIADGDLILMSAVGAGLTYGSLLIRW